MKQNIESFHLFLKGKTDFNLVPGLERILGGENDETEEPLLTLREILWMSKEMDEVGWKEHIAFVATVCYRYGAIVDVEFYSIIKQLYSLGAIDTEIQILIIECLIDKRKSFENWLDEIDEWNYKLALPPIPLNKLISRYKKQYGDFESNFWEEVAEKSGTMNDWPEILELDKIQNKILEEMWKWVNPENQKTVVEELLNRTKKDISPKSWQELDKALERADEFLRRFPTSFNVYGQSLSKIQPKAISQSDLNAFPPEKIQQIAFKYAYSRPETEEQFKVHFLGGERIGHSAILIKTKSSMILLDFGMSVINNRMARWSPLLEKVDAILLSHAHLDHSGGLPVLMRRGGSNEMTPLFGTRDTKIMLEMLLRDTRNLLLRNWEADIVQNNFTVSSLTSEANISSVLDNYRVVNIGEEFSPAPNITVRYHHASHLFGSVGMEIDIGTKKLFYTGDFNLNRGRLFDGAQFKIDDLNLLLFDGTYYGRYEDQIPPVSLSQILKDHKRIIIPAFAMGRSQEILFRLMDLDVHRERKIFLAGMGGKLLKLLNLTTDSKNIELVPTIAHQELRENTILIAGNGMLQAGTSRNVLDWTRDDDDIAVVFSGYQSPNTFGYALLNGHPVLREKYKQQVYKIKISGHSDADSLDNFLGNIRGKQVIVHSPEGAWEKGKKEGVLRPRDIVQSTF